MMNAPSVRAFMSVSGINGMGSWVRSLQAVTNPSASPPYCHFKMLIIYFMFGEDCDRLLCLKFETQPSSEDNGCPSPM